jgi:hypothetical protein
MRLSFTLGRFLSLIGGVCCILGSYKLGEHQAYERGRQYGFREAKDHYQVMLSQFARLSDRWSYLGDLWRKHPSMYIIDLPCRDEDCHESYVQRNLP